MILGIGIDILSLARFRALILRRGPDKVARRICTPGEYELFAALAKGKGQHSSLESGLDGEVKGGEGNVEGRGSGGNPASAHDKLVDRQLRFLSCRWALKEAAYKSLPHLPSLTWKHLHITHTASGAPVLTPTEHEVELMGSLSHDAGVVVGVVIAQARGQV